MRPRVYLTHKLLCTCVHQVVYILQQLKKSEDELDALNDKLARVLESAQLESRPHQVPFFYWPHTFLAGLSVYCSTSNVSKYSSPSQPVGIPR